MKILFLGLILAIMGDTQLFSTDNFTTKEGKNLQITFIKPGSLLLDFEGKKIYVDPVSDYADYSRLTP